MSTAMLVTESKSVPARAAAISLVSLAIPLGSTIWPSILPMEYQCLLWLLALVPAFLLAYYRGWGGVATSLAAGMALVSIGVAVSSALGHPLQNPPLLIGVLAAYISISLGVGAVSAQFHRDREAMFHLAQTDPLTGLRNRRYASSQLHSFFDAAKDGASGMAVLLFDLDHFKQYNDSHGHSEGDEALRMFANALQRAAGEDTLVSRHGGEEFLVALVGKSQQAVLAYVQRVRWNMQVLSAPNRVITVSVGAALFDENTKSLALLIEAADKALYAAKAAGRDCTRVAAPEDAAARNTEPASSVIEFPATAFAMQGHVDPQRDFAQDPPLVLVIEDDPAVAAFIERVLRRAHYAVVTCTDPMDAINLCHRTTPDLIIADVVLANEFGPDIVEIYRVVAPDIRVLYISGYSTADLQVFGMKLNNVLQKPFHPSTLVNEVRRMIPQPHRLAPALMA